MVLAHELGKLPNKISIEGHTDAKPFAKAGNYGNWELSADRANAARRLMQENGVNLDQVIEIRGYADQQLRKREAPEDAFESKDFPDRAVPAQGQGRGPGKRGRGRRKKSEPPIGSEAPKTGEPNKAGEH